MSHRGRASTLYAKRGAHRIIRAAANAGSGTARRRRAGRRWLGALLISSVLVLLVLGCGISLREEKSESEIFKDLSIDGTPDPNATLSLQLEYEQPYPIEVDVICSLLEVPDEEQREQERATAEAEEAEEAEGTGETEELRVDEEEDTDIEKYLVYRILEESLPANPEGGPLDEVVPIEDTIERTFAAPEQPGEYVVVCYTPEDEDNAIGDLVVVGPTPTAGG